MNAKEIQQLSYLVISEYYKNNLKPYFDYIDDDILWVGPAEKQYLRGKKAILNAWSKETNDLTFSMGNVTSYLTPVGKKTCNVILKYSVYTHYPNGETQKHNQRIDFLWSERKIITESGDKKFLPRIIKLHISNAAKLDDQDFIYAVHSQDIYTGQSGISSGKRITFRGKDYSVYYFFSDSIIYIENAENGHRSIVHTTSETIPTFEKTSYFLENYPDVFIAPHASYIVNFRHIRSIRRFAFTLDNGKTLPIPEKKYMKVKTLCAKIMSENNN